MKATWLYRVAAVVFLLFALGHTVGFLSLRPASAEGRAVYDEMNNIHFVQHGVSHSYGEFYRGFGLSATASMIFSAFVCWHLGGLAHALPQAIGALGWALFALQMVGVVISVQYIGAAGPVGFSAMLAILLGVAAWLVSSRKS